MLIAASPKPPETIMAYDELDPYSNAEVSAVHYIESENHWTQIECNQQVTTQDEKQKTNYWRQEIQMNDKLQEYHDQFYNMME